MIKVYYFIKSEASLELRKDALEKLRQSCPSLEAAVLSSAIKDAIPGRSTTLSGVLELWFECTADAEAANELSPAMLFVSPVETAFVLSGMERIVMRHPGFYTTSGVKGVYAFRRKGSMPVKDFQHYWWHNHGPLAALTENATCYSQCHLAKEAYPNGSPGYDGVTEIYWPDLPAALSALDSRQMTEDQSSDAKNFVDLESIELMIAKEHMIIPPWKENL
ncbi:MAG: EthD domain-containing protein [Pseudomonadales bacterium]|jgi:uncharacterized protein (TIGR02118 family)